MFDETLTLHIHTPGHTTGGDRREGDSCNRASNEGYPKVREDFTITEKALVGAISLITNLCVDLFFKLYTWVSVTRSTRRLPGDLTLLRGDTWP